MPDNLQIKLGLSKHMLANVLTNPDLFKQNPSPHIVLLIAASWYWQRQVIDHFLTRIAIEVAWAPIAAVWQPASHIGKLAKELIGQGLDWIGNSVGHGWQQTIPSYYVESFRHVSINRTVENFFWYIFHNRSTNQVRIFLMGTILDSRGITRQTAVYWIECTVQPDGIVIPSTWVANPLPVTTVTPTPLTPATPYTPSGPAQWSISGLRLRTQNMPACPSVVSVELIDMDTFGDDSMYHRDGKHEFRFFYAYLNNGRLYTSDNQEGINLRGIRFSGYGNESYVDLRIVIWRGQQVLWQSTESIGVYMDTSNQTISRVTSDGWHQ